MFDELRVQLRNESQFIKLSAVCSANKHFAELRTGLKQHFIQHQQFPARCP